MEQITPRLRKTGAFCEGAGGELEIQELAVPQMGALRVIEDFALDIFTLMRARALARELSYADLAVDAQRGTLSNGIEVLYASMARLLDLKAGTGRPKDATDIMVLSEIARGQRERQTVDLALLDTGPATGPAIGIRANGR